MTAPEPADKIYMQNRFSQPVNLNQFSEINEPLLVGPTGLSSFPEQYILRMLVRSPYSKGLHLTKDTLWTAGLINQATDFQKEKIGVIHPYTYLTIRTSDPTSTAAFDWHVDGFSTKYTHLPEANYVAVLGEFATEWARQAFPFPKDFNPLVHNVHLFFQKRIDQYKIRILEPWMLYFMDPYVVHRRPRAISTQARCFIRISFTPIEIPDINNTVNPLISTAHYNYDGIKEFRNSLKDYDKDYVFY